MTIFLPFARSGTLKAFGPIVQPSLSVSIISVRVPSGSLSPTLIAMGILLRSVELRRGLEQRAFVAKEPLLAWEPAAIARERGIAPDHAVTRDDDGHGVAPVGEPHRAGSGRAADRGGELAVGARRPDRYGTERRPHRPLELRAARVHRDSVERVEVAGEVGADALEVDQTGADCGEPSGISVARCAKLALRIRALTSSDSGMPMPCSS